MSLSRSRIGHTIGCVLVSLLVSAIAHAAKSLPVIPLNGTAVKIVVGGKEQTYYPVTKIKPLTLEIEGPGRLQVISRLAFGSAKAPASDYTLQLSEGSGEVKSNTSQVDPSDARLVATGAVLGKLRKFIFKVPEGTHRYTIVLSDPAGGTAYAKFRFTPAKGRRSLVSLEALSYDKIVTAVVKEKFITYYVGSKERSVQLRVIGPTRLRVSARLNYDAKMKGEQRYALTVKEKGTTINTKALATSKAVGVSYREWRDVSPGKVNSFTIMVPAGEHVYTFQLGESLAQSVGLKFSIPKQDLDNEE